MDITKVINEGLELEKEIYLIRKRVKKYIDKLEKVEDIYKEIKLLQEQEYEVYVEWKEYSSNRERLVRF